MKAAATLLLVAMALLMLMWTTRVSQTRFLRVPVEDSAQASRIAARLGTLNWKQEIADTGFLTASQHSGKLTQALTAAQIIPGESHLQFAVSFDFIDSSVTDDAVVVEEILNFVERRLVVETLTDTFTQQPPIERQRRLWVIFGSGFDSVTRTFLTAQAASDPDAELRTYAQSLLQALP